MIISSDPLIAARAALDAARTAPRRQATVTAALDALEQLITLTEQARLPRPVPFVLPATPPPLRLDDVPRQEHVKRAIEVALVGMHQITLISHGDGADAIAMAGWVNAYVPSLAAVIRACPCGNGSGIDSALLPCLCSNEAIWDYRARPEIAERLTAEIVVSVPAQVDTISIRTLDTDERFLQRVAAARVRQVKEERVGNDGVVFIPHLIDGGAVNMLRAAMRSLPISGMRLRGLLRVSASIAKLADAETIGAAHVAEAIQYRARLAGEDAHA